MAKLFFRVSRLHRKWGADCHYPSSLEVGDAGVFPGWFSDSVVADVEMLVL